VKERLLREDNLTLKSALYICRAAERSKAQMKLMKTESYSSTFDNSRRRPPQLPMLLSPTTVVLRRQATSHAAVSVATRHIRANTRRVLQKKSDLQAMR